VRITRPSPARAGADPADLLRSIELVRTLTVGRTLKKHSQAASACAKPSPKGSDLLLYVAADLELDYFEVTVIALCASSRKLMPCLTGRKWTLSTTSVEAAGQRRAALHDDPLDDTQKPQTKGLQRRPNLECSQGRAGGGGSADARRTGTGSVEGRASPGKSPSSSSRFRRKADVHSLIEFGKARSILGATPTTVPRRRPLVSGRHPPATAVTSCRERSQRHPCHSRLPTATTNEERKGFGCETATAASRACDAGSRVGAPGGVYGCLGREGTLFEDEEPVCAP
jgi:hypothetical protein